MFIILILINFLYLISGVLHTSLHSIDVYTIWLFKAKAFYVENGFPVTTLQNVNYIHSNPQYPILLPYLFSNLYTIFHDVNEKLILFLYPIIYLLILILAYRFIRKIGIPKSWSAVFVYMYSMLSPLLAQGGRDHAGNADIFITLLGWIIVSFAISKNQRPILVLILIMIASQIKQEGVFWATILLSLNLKISKKILYISLSLVPTIIWHVVKYYYQIPSSFYLYYPGIINILNNLSQLILAVILELLNYKNWYIFWPIYFLLLKSKIPQNLKSLEFTFLTILMLFVPIYIFANLNTFQYVNSSFDRILLQLSPLYIPAFSYRVYVLFNTHRRNHI